MGKTLTEMAAEILTARVKDESMTSKEIESCLNDTFEALQKLKEKEDASLGDAGQPIITPEKPSQAKPEEPSKPAVQPKKATISSTILDIIKSKPRGVNTNYIMEQTGFKKNQVWATINRAKKKGQIKTKKRGIYVSVKSREVK
jgi:predicted transcriptional regulator